MLLAKFKTAVGNSFSFLASLKGQGDKSIGNYISGIYYKDKTKVGWWKKGYPDYFAKMVNCPNWNSIIIEINNKLLDLNKCKELDVLPCSKEDLIKTSDYISIHVQGGERYKDCITIKEFDQMKKTAFLINTSRGPIVNEDDLIIALSTNVIMAYNGYTSSAQKGAANSNHNSVVKWIQNEWQKCSIGEDTAMGGSIDCIDESATPAERADNEDVVAATITSQTADTAKMNNPHTKADAVSGTTLAANCTTAM